MQLKLIPYVFLSKLTLFSIIIYFMFFYRLHVFCTYLILEININDAVYGWILFDSSGSFLACGMDRLTGLKHVHECEAIGLLEAMSWTSDMGFTNVVFECDLKMVIDAINSSEEIRKEFGSIIV